MNCVRQYFLASTALFLAAIAPGTAAAQALYNSELDARAKAALVQYEASKKAHLAFLDERLAEIDRQQASLATASVEANIAERDAAVLHILGDDQRAKAPDRLRGLAASRINAIVPGIFREDAQPNPSELKLLREILGDLDANRPDPLRLSTSEIRTAAQLLSDEFKKAKKKPTDNRTNAPTQNEWSVGWYCRFVFQPGAAGGPEQQQAFKNRVLIREAGLPAAEAATALTTSGNVCPELSDAGPDLSAFPDVRTQMAVLALGGWSSEGLPEIDPRELDLMPAAALPLRIADVGARAAKLKKELAEAEKAAKALRKERDKLVKLWGTNEAQAQLRLVSCMTDAVLQEKDPTKCDGFKEADTSGEAADAFTSLADIRGVLNQLTTAGSELQTLRQAEGFEIVQYLADPAALRTKAETDCKPGGPPAANAPEPTVEELEKREELVRLCVTDAMVQTIGLVDRIGKIRQGIPGKIAGLAVMLAEAQLEATTIRLRAAALGRRATNLDGQRRALLVELQSLMAAYTDGINPGVGKVDRGAFRIAESVRLGRVDYEKLVAQYGFIGQREFAERERAITAARYEVADSLLGTIGTAGESGIRPGDIAGLLSALGVTSLAITEAVQ